MTIRLAVAADLAQCKTLILAGPHATIMSDLRLIDFTGPNTITVVNDNAGTLTAGCVIDRDDSGLDGKVILYRLPFGALIPMRALLKDCATRAKTLGYVRWYATIPQSAAFATFRTYYEARWPYLHNDPSLANYDAGQPYRLGGDTLDQVLVNA